MDQKYYLDRDYIQDSIGDLYQVLGSLHQNNGIFVIPRYKIITNIKKDQFFWIQKETGEKFERISGKFSSKWIRELIPNQRYATFSPIYNDKMTIIPHSVIKKHFIPSERISELFNIFRLGTYQQKIKIDNIEREILEISSYLIDEWNLTEQDLGITGSVLWNGQHPHSDIDLVIYSWAATKKILEKGKKISSDQKGFRKINNIELYQKAQTLHNKSGQSVEESFEMLFQTPYLFYYNQRAVSVTFVPKVEEIPYYPLFLPETSFKIISSITVKAKIVSDRWGYYYPGLFQIKCLQFLSNNDSHKYIALSEINRLLIFEKDFIGYYNEGDHVLIRGFLQKCYQIPDFNNLEKIESYQIIIGTYEGYLFDFIKIE